jgi:hypothetical protein
MSMSIADIPKKRGRKYAGGRNPGVLVRLEPEQMAVLDKWIAAQPEPKLTRPEAIRRLLTVALDLKARETPAPTA